MRPESCRRFAAQLKLIGGYPTLAGLALGLALTAAPQLGSLDKNNPRPATVSLGLTSFS